MRAVHGCHSITLNISKNNLDIEGAKLLAAMLPKLSSIYELNIAETGITDEGLLLICDGLYNNRSIVKLNISNNFSMRNSKIRQDLVISLTQMVCSCCRLTIASIL